MKKPLSILLTAAMLLTLTACSSANNDSDNPGRDGETAGISKPAWGSETSEFTEPTETETEATETTIEETTSETTSATTASKYGVVTDYVVDIVDNYKSYGSDYHIPYVNIESDYTAEMREEIAGIFDRYDVYLERDGECHYGSSKYIAFLSPDGVISIVLVENGEWDDDKYHVWNIDCMTGQKIDNDMLAGLAGIKSITSTAKDACQAFINNRGEIVVDNYEIVSDNADIYGSAVEDTFSEDRINDNMMMGLTDDGTPFFVSDVVALGGAPSYYEIYDKDGNNLNKADGWIK